MKSNSLVAALTLLVLIFCAPAAAQTPNVAELEKVAIEELKETRTPGAVIAIVKGDKLIFSKGVGIANIETGAPVTADMIFRTGSAGKMLTAAVLVSLAEEGKIKLDEPIGTYVKGSQSETLARNRKSTPDAYLGTER